MHKLVSLMLRDVARLLFLSGLDKKISSKIIFQFVLNFPYPLGWEALAILVLMPLHPSRPSCSVNHNKLSHVWNVLHEIKKTHITSRSHSTTPHAINSLIVFCHVFCCWKRFLFSLHVLFQQTSSSFSPGTTNKFALVPFYQLDVSRFIFILVKQCHFA